MSHFPFLFTGASITIRVVCQQLIEEPLRKRIPQRIHKTDPSQRLLTNENQPIRSKSVNRIVEQSPTKLETCLVRVKFRLKLIIFLIEIDIIGQIWVE